MKFVHTNMKSFRAQMNFVCTKMEYTTIFSRHSKVSTEISQICCCVLTAGTRTACSCKVEEGRDRIGWLVNPPNLITPDCDTLRGSASHGLFPGALWLETYNPTTFSWAWIFEKRNFGITCTCLVWWWPQQCRRPAAVVPGKDTFPCQSELKLRRLRRDPPDCVLDKGWRLDPRKVKRKGG